ncbi:hypothetical protein BH11MYX2_BH11MYX2_35560 [soil metagenome]
MKRFAIVLLVLAAGCDDEKPDTAEVATAKADCKTLLEHIVQISPEGQGLDAKKFVSELPIEDIQGCMATNAFVRRCFAVAKDVPAIKACPGECVAAVIDFRADKRKEAKLEEDKPSAELDSRLSPVVEKCLAGDAKAADDYKKDGDGKRPVDATWK